MEAVKYAKPLKINRKENLKNHKWYWIGRRTQDVILSLLALVVLSPVMLITAIAYYLPLQDYFIANRDKYEKLKVNTSTISVRIPTRNTVSYADDDLVVVAKSCYCFDSNRDMIIKVR